MFGTVLGIGVGIENPKFPRIDIKTDSVGTGNGIGRLALTSKGNHSKSCSRYAK